MSTPVIYNARFKSAYAQYWDIVKHSVDEEGWVYSEELPSSMLDAYFEHNTGKKIEFQKHYSGEWKGVRWRPKELSQ